MSFKKKIITLLLVCFSFVVLHDFVFEYLDPCEKQTVLCTLDVEKKNGDTICQLHSDIHNHPFLLEDMKILFPSLKSEKIFYKKTLYEKPSFRSVFRPPAA